MKRIQNKVAESRKTLPGVILYSIAVWFLAGLVQQQWWIQFFCFALASFLMVELNRLNVLIRIYSRMVSVVFIVLSSAAVFLFPSVVGAVIQLCFIASLATLYNCYQDKATPGWTFYTFLFLGIASIADVHILFFVPVFWLMMATIVYSLCWRTFIASLLGLLTPYWFWTAWTLWQENGNPTPILQHFSDLVSFQVPYDQALTTPQLLLLALVAILGLIGSIHFLRTSYLDKIRTRQLYYSFFIIGLSALTFLILQPQHYDMLIRIIIIAASPLIGHFIALTRTRLTNIAFLIITGAILILTAVNLWISLSHS